MEPFDEIKVLELGRVFSGPLCGMVLADLGARVLKIERPERGDESRRFGAHSAGGSSCYFNSLNRGKQSLALDLGDDEDRQLFTELLTGADVIVHNWIQSSLDRRGFSYEAARALNPRLVYCAIGGYGRGTAFAERPAQDVIAQALSGLMSLTGEADGPPLKTAIPVVDYATGLYAAFAIMAALFRRQLTGEGQLVTISLLESALAMTSFASSTFLSTEALLGRTGNRHPSICPYDMYATADGPVVLAVANDAMWERFCAALGLDELRRDPRFRTNKDRLSHREELEAILAPKLAALPSSDVLDRLQTFRVSAAPVHDLAGAFGCDEVRELDMRLRWGGDDAVEVVGNPLRLDGQRLTRPEPPPALDQQGEEIRRRRDW
jgi:crotonobetainyl-CoA:carnitine CoA-transferase CaiB-like acyl-CoA transferase